MTEFIKSIIFFLNSIAKLNIEYIISDIWLTLSLAFRWKYEK